MASRCDIGQYPSDPLAPGNPRQFLDIASTRQLCGAPNRDRFIFILTEKQQSHQFLIQDRFKSRIAFSGRKQ
jgi:hypothetical protein